MMRVVLPATTRVRLRGLAPAWPVLLLLTLLTRLPLRSGWLYHWDSVNFAFALDRFDVAQGQPHAPGYLLYVLLGRAAAWLTGDAQRGYVLLAILGSALAAGALYDLGRWLWDAATGWLAALLLLSSPLFWFYGEVALPHTLDALAVIVAATLSWRVAQGERRAALWLALWLGLAGGLRPQTLVFLLPLALVAGWLGLGRAWRWQIGAVLLLLITVLLWLVPLLALSGGLARYLSIVAGYSATFDRPTSVFLGAGWAGLLHNLDKLVRYTLWGWAGGTLLVVGLLLQGDRRHGRDQRGWLLLLWTLPCLLFYSLIHMGQQGLIFVYLPVLLLLSARGGVRLWRSRRWGPGLVLLALVLNLGLYLGGPAELLPGRLKLLTQATIREHDALVAAQLDAVRHDLPPGALLLADEWRFPQYYLREVALLPYRPADETTTVAPELDPPALARLKAARTLAWYEPSLDRFNRAPEQTSLATDRGGVRLRVLTRAPDQRFYVTSNGFGVER